MREHVHSAARRRDERLAHVRKLSLWITGGAAFASIGLGTAFAHALPGHASGTSSSSGQAATSGTPAGSSAGSVAPASSSPGPQAAGHHGRHHRHKLAAPVQQPAQSAAPPVVSSGGS
jgi:hypothetical protein